MLLLSILMRAYYWLSQKRLICFKLNDLKYVKFGKVAVNCYNLASQIHLFAIITFEF